MSTDDKSEILDALKVIKGMLGWLGGGALIACFGVAWVIVTDHFEQAELREDMDVIKPRVERLWYRAFPDSSSASPHDVPLVTRK